MLVNDHHHVNFGQNKYNTLLLSFIRYGDIL